MQAFGKAFLLHVPFLKDFLVLHKTAPVVSVHARARGGGGSIPPLQIGLERRMPRRDPFSQGLPAGFRV